MMVMAVGCDSHTDILPVLDRAEAIVEEHPDSAQKMLEAFYPYRHLNDEEKARCGVLLASAKLRQNKSIALDGLLDKSIAYYIQKGDSVELSKAYQLKAYQASWRGRQDSTEYYLHKAMALITPDDTEQSYSMNMRLSDIFSTPSSVKDYSKSIDYAKKAMKYAVSDNQRAYACNQIGACYGFLNRNDSALTYAEHAVNLSQNGQSNYTTYVLNYANTPGADFVKAERYLNQIAANSLGAVITLGYLHINNHNIAKAQEYAHKADSTYISNPGKYSINTYNSMLALKSCVAFGAGESIPMTEGVSRNDSISQTIAMNEARRREFADNALLLQKYSQREQLRHQRIIGLILGAVFLATIVFFLYDRRNKKRYIELRKELDRSRVEQIELQTSDSTPSDEELMAIWRKRADICLSNFTATGWLKRIQAIEGKSDSNKDYLPISDRVKLRTALFEEFTDVIIDLKTSGEGINLDDIFLCLLSLLRTGNPTISQCMGVSENAVRTRKSRLKEKIAPAMYKFIFER